MSEIDIRDVRTNKITRIQYSGSRRGADDYAALTNTNDVGISIVLSDDPIEYLITVSRRETEDLIMALQKAIDLGWVK